MTVTSTRINPRQATFGLQNQNTYQVHYRIVSDALDGNPPTILAEAQMAASDAVPQLYATYAADANAVCTNIELTQDNDDDKRRWRAVATFSQLPPGQEPGDAVDDPTLRPTKWQVEYIEELEPIGEYYHETSPGVTQKRLLRNGASQEFIDPVMQERIYPVLVGMKNIGNDAMRAEEFALDQIIQWNIDFESSVNSLEFRGGAERTVRWLPIQAGGITTENGVSFYPCSFRFAYKPDTWDRRIVNQGFYYRDLSRDNTKVYRAKDGDGNDTVEPVLLVANGTLAPLDANGVPVDPANSVLVRNTRPLKDYNTIGL